MVIVEDNVETFRQRLVDNGGNALHPLGIDPIIRSIAGLVGPAHRNAHGGEAGGPDALEVCRFDPRATVRAAETFHARAQRFALELADGVHALVPFAPDSNLVCLALNPCGNTSVAAANAFVRALHDTLRCDPRQPLQTKEFFGSVTSLRADMLGTAQTARIFAALGLDPASFVADDDRLLILRHTLMNPFLIDHENGISYIDRYFDFLARRVHSLLATTVAPP